MNLKVYQNEAILRLTDEARNLLTRASDSNNIKRMIFHAPTGSGKTMMMAEFLSTLASTLNKPEFCCIWLAPGKLHKQSFKKITQHCEKSRALECRYFSDLAGDRKIKRHEILFLNWESIRQESHIIIRENEREFNLENVLQRTRDDNLKIILVIDESHRSARTEISTDLIKSIAPSLAIEMSATPEFKDPDALVRVSLDEVKRSGMIKKSVFLNDGFNEALKGEVKSPYAEKSNEVVLGLAIRRRKELAAAFKMAGRSVNPLLCIQLPDANRLRIDSNIKEEIIQSLRRHGITIENGNLAVYLSNEKENMDNVDHSNSNVDALIFKQAIALGWDCPRAHILVLFREWKSVSFSVQTLGRIMRMPEPHLGHYESDFDILNKAYVYTNLSNMSIKEDVAGGYVHVHCAHRADNYTPLKLQSVHRIRQRERTRLSPLFIEKFLQSAKDYELKEKIDMNDQTVKEMFINDYNADSVDRLLGQIIQGKLITEVKNEDDLQNLFVYFASKNLSPYYPELRSIERIRRAIYAFFGGPLEMDCSDHFEKIVRIVLSKSNQDHFVHVINMAKKEYENETLGPMHPLHVTNEWEVPESVTYGEQYLKREVKKSIMVPFYVGKPDWKTEKSFVNCLEQSENVRWWYKNGEGDSMYFAIPYSKNEEEYPFYVDFIVEFDNGTIGLYDTKIGRTLREDGGHKSDGLLNYIKNSKNRQLRGGIVKPADPNNYDLGWEIYKGEGKNITGVDGWEPLIL